MQVQLRGQAGQYVLEVSPRIIAIELGRLRQAHHDSSTLSRQFASITKTRPRSRPSNAHIPKWS